MDVRNMRHGMKVRIVRKKTGSNWADPMCEYLGQVMTVDTVSEEFDGVRMVEDGGMWFWNDYMLDSIAYEDDDIESPDRQALAGLFDCME